MTKIPGTYVQQFIATPLHSILTLWELQFLTFAKCLFGNASSLSDGPSYVLPIHIQLKTYNLLFTIILALTY